MSDQSPTSDEERKDDGSVSKKDVAVQISYCPALGLYHYKRFDEEYFFNNENLEESLEAYLLDGKNVDAEFMAKLTSWARAFPHKIVTFFADKTFKICAPEVSTFEDELDESHGSDGGGQSGPQEQGPSGV